MGLVKTYLDCEAEVSFSKTSFISRLIWSSRSGPLIIREPQIFPPPAPAKSRRNLSSASASRCDRCPSCAPGWKRIARALPRSQPSPVFLWGKHEVDFPLRSLILAVLLDDRH